MGNATRCESLIETLTAEYDIDVLTSGRAAFFFKSSPYLRHLYKQNELSLPTAANLYGTTFFYAISLPHFILRLLKNWFEQLRLIRLNQYDMIIFDSDYGFILHRLFGFIRLKQPKLVGINNSADVVQYFKENPGELSNSLKSSYIVEYLDYFFYRHFCHHVIAPSLFPPLKLTDEPKITRINPLVRRILYKNSRQDSQSSESSHLSNTKLVCGSSSGIYGHIFQELLKYFKIETQMFLNRNEDRIQNCSVIISNSGQSTVAEAITLEKCLITIPIPMHAEQYVNARLAMSYGATCVFSTDDFAFSQNSLQTGKKCSCPWDPEENKIRARNVLTRLLMENI